MPNKIWEGFKLNKIYNRDNEIQIKNKVKMLSNNTEGKAAVKGIGFSRLIRPKGKFKMPSTRLSRLPEMLRLFD